MPAMLNPRPSTASDLSWKYKSDISFSPTPSNNNTSPRSDHDPRSSSRQRCARTVIEWDGPHDPENPFNWPDAKKWSVSLLACFMTFVVQLNGTMMTSAAEQINESFSISDEHFPHSYWPVLSWNLGGAAAPLIGLPLMENFGVRNSYLVCFFVCDVCLRC